MAMSLNSLNFLALLTSATLIAVYFIRRARAYKNLPPGPRPIPIIGNVFDLPSTTEPYLLVDEWAKKYGNITYLHIFGQSIIFVNSAEVANELIEKRGAIYSGKPHLVMIGELCGCEKMSPFTDYGEPYKRRRKLMQLTLGPRNIPKYYSRLEPETSYFIRALVSDPANYLQHIRRYSGGLTLSIVYGHFVTSKDDEYLQLAEECMDLLENKLVAGVGIWPVDVFPALRYLPEWFPGASFKKKAKVWKLKLAEFVEKPYARAKAIASSGEANSSFCSSFLNQNIDLTPEQEDDLKWTANSMYAASADTTMTTISHLMLAMIEYPDAFVKAREEIEEVIGKGRLPTFSDRASLPYVDAILNETWRWAVPVPLNLPHSLSQDDVYEGYAFPKGTLVVANIWTMLRDESLFPDASSFKPERYMADLPEDQKRKMDPRNYIFGFGRRRCPGADLVDSSIWLLVATMIATVDVSKFKNADGSLEAPVVEFRNPVFRIPKRFKFSINLRSQLLENAL